MKLDGQLLKFAACRAERVHRDDVNLNELGQACQTSIDAASHGALKRVRPRVIAHDMTDFQQPETRYRKLDHLTSQSARIRKSRSDYCGRIVALPNRRAQPQRVLFMAGLAPSAAAPNEGLVHA